MPALEIAIVTVGLAGAAGVAWALLPMLRSEEVDAEPEPSAPSDFEQRVSALQRPLASEPEPATWTERLAMLPDRRRLPAEIRPCERLPVARIGSGAALLPIASALLELPGDAETLRGRHHGRAFHLVRLDAGVYLDLVEAVRLLPVLGVEADARGLEIGEVVLYRSLPEAEHGTGVPAAQIDALAAWIVGLEGSRVVPEGGGARRFVLRFAAGTLSVQAWMPSVARGISQDHLEWAGVATWHGTETVVDAGATSLEVLTKLVDDPEGVRSASLESWRWTQTELAEAAALGFTLDGEGIDITTFLDEAFADRCVPVPTPGAESEALVAAATLNWRGVIARRAGFVQSALAVFDAGLSVCGDADDDTRADLHHNRALAGLLLAMGAVTPDPPPSEFPSAEVLGPVLEGFELATRLNPLDLESWILRAVVHQLLDEKANAADCWLQAATRAHNPEVQARLIANADTVR